MTRQMKTFAIHYIVKELKVKIAFIQCNTVFLYNDKFYLSNITLYIQSL